MENKYSQKILNVQSLIEKYDEPNFACNKFFYEQHKIYPSLAVILTNDNQGSISYVKGIKKFCEKNYVSCKDYRVSSSKDLIKTIDNLNNDKTVHGIMVMYPTGYQEKDTMFMNMINPMKDLEGLHNSYLGYLVQYEKFRDPEHLKKLVIPPTAKGILSILKRYAIDYENYYKKYNIYPENNLENHFDLEGKRITIINDSLAVGRSLALMLLNENAYVQVCHQYTPFAKVLESVKDSDIIISAVPSASFVIPTDSISEKSIVIDISFEGNFEYPSVIEKCFKIAPRWDIVTKGNRINDMTLNRLISNLHYLINCCLPDVTLLEMQKM
ncbi:MAG: bifunctional 5,10-methylenetetrahydrofolate dehydrogenase/5,10-methenyltetrahydrofolate cyclohydrolase [Bacteroidales bacterium]|nr:bifunctional 5,10-methylenetetrahydrofolate dehydrogenase/5,10-methenyltetrahydrofolate cyclohydrolase [Bacteroidales bacterium]